MGLALVAGAADSAMAEALRQEGYTVHGLTTAEANPGACRTMTVVAEGTEREAMLACVARLRPEVLVPVGKQFTYAACQDWAVYGKQTGLLVPPREAFEAAHQPAECRKWCERLGIAVPALLEENVPGREELTKSVLLLFGGDSRLRAAFTARGRPRESSWEGEAVERIRPFFATWAWRGPAQVWMKFDRRDGRDQVLAIRPWWPESLRFVAEAYPGMLSMAVRLARGEEVAGEAYPAYARGRREDLGFPHPVLYSHE